MASEGLSFREYLHRVNHLYANMEAVPAYDEFIDVASDLMDMRIAAENYYAEHPNCAYSSSRALPLPWQEIATIVGETDLHETLESQIAKTLYVVADGILTNLRKVLMRVRHKESLGRVQQVDHQCLRWLTRQPGHTAIEKSGSRQEILAVVRVENFDTLENRVFKDFLIRSSARMNLYLRRNAETYPTHEIITAVRRFRQLCLMGLSLPIMQEIRSIGNLPQPNYVLRQDARYSRIWKAYCRLVRQERVTERLWENRETVVDAYDHCKKYCASHVSPYAAYAFPMWVNNPEVTSNIFDTPIWEWDHEWKNPRLKQVADIPLPDGAGDIRVVNLSSPWDARDELVYGRNHSNAKPYIQNPHQPNPEPVSRSVRLGDILKNRMDAELRDYFEQLHDLIGGNEWVILVPDNWSAQWLEKILRCCPLPRSRVFLLWRSIAAALGCREFTSRLSEGDTLSVLDVPGNGEYIITRLRYHSNPEGGSSLLPQRASYRLHGDDRFEVGPAGTFTVSVRSKLPAGSCALGCGMLSASVKSAFGTQTGQYAEDADLVAGALYFKSELAKHHVTYFDELEALSLVQQTRAEEVCVKQLIQGDECWPGGTKFVSAAPIYAGMLPANEKTLSLYMYEGVPDLNDRLKEYIQQFDEETEKTQRIYFVPEMSPGQGLAIVHVHADFLRDRHLDLDLSKLKDSEYTRLIIEQKLMRTFPPHMPYVEASEDAWDMVSSDVDLYLDYGFALDRDAFAKAQSYWGAVSTSGSGVHSLRSYGVKRMFDPKTMAPTDILKRENVFGNNPENQYPVKNGRRRFEALFGKLAEDWLNGIDTRRLIAWTYQCDNPAYEPIRSHIYTKYMTKNKIDIVDYTIISNCFRKDDQRLVKMLVHALNHILNSVEGVLAEEFLTIDSFTFKWNALRLIYNLLQFYPALIAEVDTGLCERFMARMLMIYNCLLPEFRAESKWTAGHTLKVGYMIKCMLFMLHRRRYDASFFKFEGDWVPEGDIAHALPRNSAMMKTYEETRQAFIDYVNGRGTMKGIPNE